MIQSPEVAGEMREIGPISVAICNYEGAAYLPPLLDSLRAQTHPIDEILLVDNASSDESLAVVAERYPEVRAIVLDQNGGPSPARNRGMEAARNRWVLALDNDVVLAPDALERLVQAARERTAAVALQPRSVFDSEPSRVHYDGGDLHYVGLFALRNFYAPLTSAVGSGTLLSSGIVSLAVLVDRDAVLGVGGYDETYFILFEDLDLSYRLRAAGGELYSVEDAIVRHKGGTPGISFREGPRYPSRRVALHARNRWVYLLKCYRVRTLLLALPGIALYELASLAFALRSGAIGAWFRGRWQALRLLPHIARSRRRIQAGRVRADRELLVGGPLTVTPAVATGGRSRVLAVLSGLLGAWWRVVGFLV